MNRNRTLVTHDDIQRALARFRRQGGTITRLPDEVPPYRSPVGLRAESWSVDLAALGARDDAAPEGPHRPEQGQPSAR